MTVLRCVLVSLWAITMGGFLIFACLAFVKLNNDRRRAYSPCGREELGQIYGKCIKQETEWEGTIPGEFRELTLDKAAQLSRSVCEGMGAKSPELRVVGVSPYLPSVEASYVPKNNAVYFWGKPTIRLTVLVHELTHHVVRTRANLFNPAGVVKYLVCDSHGAYFRETERALFKAAERALKGRANP